MNQLDRKIFYYNDARFVYSINDLKCLVSDKVTAPDSIIRITEGLSFRADDITKNAATIFSDLLSLAIEDPALEAPEHSNTL